MAQRNRPAEADTPADDTLADLRQQAAEETLEQAEFDAVVDLEDVGRAAALEQLHREPDDDQPAWRAS
jgi:hypothetical protein